MDAVTQFNVPRLADYEATAQLFGVSTATVRRWVYEGRLSCHRLGRQVRFTESDIREFIDRGHQAAS